MHVYMYIRFVTHLLDAVMHYYSFVVEGFYRVYHVISIKRKYVVFIIARCKISKLNSHMSVSKHYVL